MRVSALLTECADSQRTYLQALSSYRASLKDVLEREKEVRTILRDREILVTRVLRLSSKRPGHSEKAAEAYNVKIDEASKELGACEAALKAEEMALAGVKLRIFKEALGMRLRSQSDMGLLWHETANEAIGLLDRLRPEQIPDHVDFRPAFLEENDGPYNGSPRVGSNASLHEEPIQDGQPQENDEAVSDSSSVNDNRPTVAHVRGASEPIQSSRSPRGSFSTPNRSSRASAIPFPATASGRRTTTVPEEAPMDTSDEEDAMKKSFGHRNQRQTVSESGYTDSNAGGGKKEKSGFFGGITNLFRSRKMGENGTPPSSPRKGKDSRWSTRTDSNLHVIEEQNAKAEKAERDRAAMAFMRDNKSKRGRRGSGSSDEKPRNLIKVVNRSPPMWEDLGISSAAPTMRPKKQRAGSFSATPSNVPHRPQKAMSDPGDFTVPMKPRKVKKSTSSNAGLERPAAMSRSNSSASAAQNRHSVSSGLDTWTVTPNKKATKYTPSLLSVVSDQNPPSPVASRSYGNNLGANGTTLKKKKTVRASASANGGAPTSMHRQSRPASVNPETVSINTLALPSASDYKPSQPDQYTTLELPSAAASRTNAMTRTERSLSTLTLPSAPPPVSSMPMATLNVPEPTSINRAASINRAPSPIAMPSPQRRPNGILHSPNTPRSRSPVGGESMERRKSVRIADDESVNGVFGGENVKSEKARGKERAVDNNEEASGWVSRIGVQDDSDDVRSGAFC